MPYPNKPLYSVIQHQRKLILEVPNSVRDCCLKDSCSSCFQHCYILTEQWFYTNSKLYRLLIHCLLKLSVCLTIDSIPYYLWFNSKNFELWVSV